jgi:hypothetical protein
MVVTRMFPRGMGISPTHGRDGHATSFAAIAIFVVAVGLAVLQLIPPADTGTVVGWSLPSWKMFPS